MVNDSATVEGSDSVMKVFTSGPHVVLGFCLVDFSHFILQISPLPDTFMDVTSKESRYTVCMQIDLSGANKKSEDDLASVNDDSHPRGILTAREISAARHVTSG